MMPGLTSKWFTDRASWTADRIIVADRQFKRLSAIYVISLRTHKNHLDKPDTRRYNTIFRKDREVGGKGFLREHTSSAASVRRPLAICRTPSRDRGRESALSLALKWCFTMRVEPRACRSSLKVVALFLFPGIRAGALLCAPDVVKEDMNYGSYFEWSAARI